MYPLNLDRGEGTYRRDSGADRRIDLKEVFAHAFEAYFIFHIGQNCYTRDINEAEFFRIYFYANWVALFLSFLMPM